MTSRVRFEKGGRGGKVGGGYSRDDEGEGVG